MRKLFGVTTLALLLFMGQPHIAESDPSITGDLEVDIVTGDISNAAIGSDSTASVAIGSVLDGEIVGDVTITVKTGAIVNSADGAGAVAKVRIGVVGN